MKSVTSWSDRQPYWLRNYPAESSGVSRRHFEESIAKLEKDPSVPQDDSSDQVLYKHFTSVLNGSLSLLRHRLSLNLPLFNGT